MPRPDSRSVTEGSIGATAWRQAPFGLESEHGLRLGSGHVVVGRHETRRTTLWPARKTRNDARSAVTHHSAGFTLIRSLISITLVAGICLWRSISGSGPWRRVRWPAGGRRHGSGRGRVDPSGQVDRSGVGHGPDEPGPFFGPRPRLRHRDGSLGWRPCVGPIQLRRRSSWRVPTPLRSEGKTPEGGSAATSHHPGRISDVHFDYLDGMECTDGPAELERGLESDCLPTAVPSRAVRSGEETSGGRSPFVTTYAEDSSGSQWGSRCDTTISESSDRKRPVREEQRCMWLAKDADGRYRRRGRRVTRPGEAHSGAAASGRVILVLVLWVFHLTLGVLALDFSSYIATTRWRRSNLSGRGAQATTWPSPA